MIKEIIAQNKRGEDKHLAIFIDYERGVLLPLEDLELLYGEDFILEARKEAEDSEPLNYEYEGELIECITIVTMIEAVLSTPEPDKTALYSILGAIEESLVRVWG